MLTFLRGQLLPPAGHPQTTGDPGPRALGDGLDWQQLLEHCQASFWTSARRQPPTATCKRTRPNYNNTRRSQKASCRRPSKIRARGVSRDRLVKLAGKPSCECSRVLCFQHVSCTQRASLDSFLDKFWSLGKCSQDELVRAFGYMICLPRIFVCIYYVFISTPRHTPDIPPPAANLPHCSRWESSRIFVPVPGRRRG